ncbi:MAG: hypothetical protein HY560_10565 [Gemmatimonadetes bacterium]|nr:hypothetical protein [Gemmatimonadota bacterium]
MTHKQFWLVIAAVGLGGGETLQAQATGMPSFNAPYRAFARSEFGGTVSFPQGADLAIEGQLRFGYQKFDIGARGGFVDNPGGINASVLLGAEARGRVITHTEQFPLDGALVVGLGGNFRSGASTAIMVGGLSLGRRVDPRNSQVSIIPYGEPTIFITSGGGATILNFALGLGADFRLSRVFDVRASVGLGDIEGISVSAVWVH